MHQRSSFLTRPSISPLALQSHVTHGAHGIIGAHLHGNASQTQVQPSRPDLGLHRIDVCERCYFRHANTPVTIGSHTVTKWIEFYPRLPPQQRAVLLKMVQRENELRLSPATTAAYRAAGVNQARRLRHSHNVVILQIREQVVAEFLSAAMAVNLYATQEAGIAMLRDAPHRLGAEAAKHSNYIAGSFAAYPPARAHLVQIGDTLSSNVTVALPPAGQLTSLLSLITRTPSIAWTVVLAGSST
jgi:hypothetical protein